MKKIFILAFLAGLFCIAGTTMASAENRVALENATSITPGFTTPVDVTVKILNNTFTYPLCFNKYLKVILYLPDNMKRLHILNMVAKDGTRVRNFPSSIPIGHTLRINLDYDYHEETPIDPHLDGYDIPHL